MMNTLIFAIGIRNKYLRWVPIVIIAIELLVLPQSYPSGCQNIFLGTIPAIPLVITFALVLSSLRKRLYKQDAEQISSAFADEENVRKYEDALEYEYKAIISELEDFNQELPILTESAASNQIENAIQKIRAFLVCSEQFESEIVRELYRFVIGRLRNGVPTRMHILGEFIYQFDQSAPINGLLTQLSSILAGIPCELSLIKLNKLVIEIQVEDKYFQTISDQLTSLTFTNLEVLLKRL
jgi:hypothetical protein